uniref:Uncharacterized protein n=1 Tax=Oncorhynchus tshawytscha TaxID=74940 RepID=A0A8C8JLZ0_ONCTS
ARSTASPFGPGTRRCLPRVSPRARPRGLPRALPQKREKKHRRPRGARGCIPPCLRLPNTLPLHPSPGNLSSLLGPCWTRSVLDPARPRPARFRGRPRP